MAKRYMPMMGKINTFKYKLYDASSQSFYELT